MTTLVNPSLRFVLTASLAFALAACGFSLRGSDVLSSKFQILQLDSEQVNNELSRLIRRRLENAEVIIEPISTANPNSELPLLLINNEKLVSRPVTVNPRARAAQYEMRLSVDISLGQFNEYLISPETLFVERSYFEDIENISGNQEEVEIIAAEMRTELINQLMRRLAAVEV